METAVVKPRCFRKTRIAASLATAIGALGAVTCAFGQALVPVMPPPITSYPGDPGTAGNPASWRTAEFLRDWGLRAIGAEFAYAAGFAGQTMNVGVVDSGYFATNPGNIPNPIPVGWLPEHQDVNGVDRWISVTANGGTSGPTPGFFNQSYNDTHGTHVSGTTAARRDGGAAPLQVTPNQPVTSDMHGVSFDANVSFGNTHKTDSVYYGLQPATTNQALLLDNGYIENVYPSVAASVSTLGTPVRIIHSSWGSQSPLENFSTYCPPPGGTQSFGELAAWNYISTPDGTPDANGNLNHWLNGAIAVARGGVVISYSAGNGGYIYTTPRGSSSYFLPDLEGHWITETGISQTGQTFNADGSILVPGTEQFNQCGLAKWACMAAPSNAINSTTVSVISGTPTATYGSESGTSMAGPHGASSLNLVMQRFPYMSNDQALYTMYTTGRQNATISNPTTGAAMPNPTAGQMVQVPDTRNGWGTVSLRDAFNGPGQMFGRFSVNTAGYSDVWSNNISDVAIKERQTEDATEAALWQSSQVTNTCVLSLPPGSPLAATDYAAGVARAAARATRVYVGELLKAGAGTLFLTGANTYTGVTSVSGGKVSITQSLASPVTVAGGTFGGIGTVSAAVTMVSGMLWPGLSPAEAAFINNGVTVHGDVLAVSGVKMGANGGFVVSIYSGTDYSQLQSTGLTILNGTLMIDLEGAPAPGSVLTIVSSATPIHGTFTGLPEGHTFVSGGQTFTISYLNNNVTLTVQGGPG